MSINGSDRQRLDSLELKVEQLTDAILKIQDYLNNQPKRQKSYNNSYVNNRSQEIQDYLDLLNRELQKEQWLLTCLRFAPNAPQQNPVEDIWLQAKRFIREFYFFCHSFTVIKELFELSTHCQIFDFPKLNDYGVFS